MKGDWRFPWWESKTGKIHSSNSPQVSPFFCIKKKDGSFRPCQDYHYINKHMIHDIYPLPLISNLIDKLQGAKIFTKFDICWGYNNVHIKDGHQWKAAFITHKGLFELTIMFFGLTNSPTTFQWFMNDSFCDMITKGWLVFYMDGLLIYSPDTATHIEQTKRVLQCMVELDLYFKLKKCTFAISEVKYLGMIVKPGQLAMNLVKLNGIVYWPAPSKVKDVCSFLGFSNFYCQFIPNYSTLTCSLIDLTKKNLPWNWTSSQQLTFNHLKCLFLSEPVLHILTSPLPLPLPFNGFDSFLVMVDHGLTKGVILCLTKKTITMEVLQTTGTPHLFPPSHPPHYPTPYGTW